MRLATAKDLQDACGVGQVNAAVEALLDQCVRRATTVVERYLGTTFERRAYRSVFNVDPTLRPPMNGTHRLQLEASQVQNVVMKADTTLDRWFEVEPAEAAVYLPWVDNERGIVHLRNLDMAGFGLIMAGYRRLGNPFRVWPIRTYIEVTYTAGFDTKSDAYVGVPDALREATLLIGGQLYHAAGNCCDDKGRQTTRQKSVTDELLEPLLRDYIRFFPMAYQPMTSSSTAAA